MTAKEIEKIIMHEGWKLHSITGSHHHYKNPNKAGRVTIPFHSGDIPKGTLNSILKQAGLK